MKCHSLFSVKKTKTKKQKPEKKIISSLSAESVHSILSYKLKQK